MKKIILSIFFLIFVLSCALFEKKQVFSGTVVSKVNKHLMEGVKVHIKDTDISALTDSTGFYTITSKDLSTFQLAFIHKGYDTTEVDVVVDENKSRYEINVALERKK
ncbi:MAG: carboxypeptidase-like regulatory domain-containing protein [bacterium]